MVEINIWTIYDSSGTARVQIPNPTWTVVCAWKKGSRNVRMMVAWGMVGYALTWKILTYVPTCSPEMLLTLAGHLQDQMVNLIASTLMKQTRKKCVANVTSWRMRLKLTFVSLKKEKMNIPILYLLILCIAGNILKYRIKQKSLRSSTTRT